MPEWLQDFFQNDPDAVKVSLLAKRLSVAFVLGCVVAGVYRVTHGKRGQSAGLTATLVLLTVLIAMVTLVIGNNVARAFSLVGALAIVRFRTVVEDTRDTAFVIFAVAMGMAVGAGFPEVALIGLPFVAVAAFLFRPRDAATPLDFTLSVRIGAGHNPDALLRETFAKHLERCRLTATTTARQGAAFDLTYAVRLRCPDGALPLVAELNGLEGVQSVELRQV
jgi:uncharacterized membrane protein YhiD involved in acid resistance